MFELLDNNMNLCKAAAGSLNTMKTQVTDSQTRLIAIKNVEIVRKVKKIVQTEMKTLANFFERNMRANMRANMLTTANDQISEGGSEKEEQSRT